MKVLVTLLGLLSLAVSTASATALTYKLGANEKACFFALNDRIDSKIAFYFAVGVTLTVALSEILTR